MAYSGTLLTFKALYFSELVLLHLHVFLVVLLRLLRVVGLRHLQLRLYPRQVRLSVLVLTLKKIATNFRITIFWSNISWLHHSISKVYIRAYKRGSFYELTGK